MAECLICRSNTLLLFRCVLKRVFMRMCMSILLFMCLSMLIHVLVQLSVSMALPSCATDVDKFCTVLFLGSPHPKQ